MDEVLNDSATTGQAPDGHPPQPGEADGFVCPDNFVCPDGFEDGDDIDSAAILDGPDDWQPPADPDAEPVDQVDDSDGGDD